MAIDFPTSPSVNDIHTSGGRRWTWNGTSWERSGTPGPGDIISSTNDNTTSTLYPVLVTGTGSNTAKIATTASKSVSFNASNGTLTATTFSGNATTATEATNVTAVNNSTTNTAYRIPFLTAATGTAQLQTDNADGLIYNPSENKLTAINLQGTLATAAQPSVTSLGTLSSLNVTGNVSIGGVLTYEDVKNVDSVGIITARAGIKVTGGNVSIGDAATHTYSAHSEGDDLVIGGAGWRGMTIYGEGGGGVIQFADAADNRIGQILYNHGDNSMDFRTNGNQTRLRITSAGNVGIGSAIPGTEFDVLGTGTVANFKGTGGDCFIGLTDVDAGAGVGYIGSDGGDLLFQTAGSSYSTKLSITVSGNVGINDATPSFKLDVNGTGRFTDDLTINTTKKILTNSSTGQLTIQPGPSYPGGSIKFAGGQSGATDRGTLIFYAGETTSLQERLRITSNGKVAVGNLASPDGNLHVFNSSAGSVTAATDANELVLESAANVGMSFLTANDALSRIKFGDPDATNAGIIIYSHADDSFRFQHTSNERLRIASDGEIFMGANFGTANRSTLLSISGANQDPAGVWTQVGVYADGGQAVNKGGSIGFGGPDGSTSQQQFSAIKGAKENGTSGNYAGYMAFYTRPAGAVSGERLRITSTGLVGINCTPNKQLEVKGTDVAFRLLSTVATGRIGMEFYDTSAQKGYFGYASSSNDEMSIQQNEAADLWFYVNGGERLRIHADGEVECKGGAAGQNALLVSGNYSGSGNVDIQTWQRIGGAVQAKMIYKDADTSMHFGTDTAHKLCLMTGGTERLRLNTNGYAEFAGANDLRLTLGSTGTAGTNTANWLRASGADLMYNAASGAHRWEVGGAQKLELTSGGNLNVGGDYTQTAYKAQITGDLLLQKSQAAYQHPQLELYASSNTAHGGAIKFTAMYNSKYQLALIKAYGGSGSPNSSGGSLGFSTGDGTEKLQIQADGNLNFGTTNEPIIRVDTGNATNGSCLKVEIDGVEEFRFDPGKFEFKNQSNLSRGTLLGGINYYSNTNAYVDLTQWRLSDDWNHLEVFGYVNPNSAGSGQYTDPVHMYIYRGIGWANGGIKHFIYSVHVAPPARQAFQGGSGMSGNSGVSAVWCNSGSVVGNESATGSHYIRLIIPNANASYNFQKSFRILRRF